ncbi:MAG TPA: choice-of-anchor C family protein [Actinophytocola sp.]|uniref:choice-of-anchor C family protein n=1 Tax=Actinophytocola sp. TaxID=1872138 RepID=UPI002DDD0589|nr:choice-of-anchor C family protein [Actinophytocola sp.]HEV2779942.1 choice-of-anchor C family protein [Actinophytocola sp.]
MLLAIAGAPAAAADGGGGGKVPTRVVTSGFGVQSVAFADGFESPVVAPNTFASFVAGQQMGVWTVTQIDVHLIGQNFWQATEGVQSLDLDGAFNGGVAVAFQTLPLFAYRVSYDLAGNPDGGPNIKTGLVRVNGAPAQDIVFDTTGKSRTNMGYVKKSFTVLSTSSSMTLEFLSTTTPGGWGPVIDDVVVEKCLLILCL